jgi:hypothetical protein
VNPSSEVLLVGLIFALYLTDCVRLLDPDEALLIGRGPGRWAPGFGARHWRLAGKEPFLVNPLLPDQAVFRLRWRPVPAVSPAADPSSNPPQTRTVELPVQATRLGYFAWATWLLLFVTVPLCLLARLGPAATLPAAALVYASVLASLAAAWAWRVPLQLGASAFGLLAFECLACPPHAANIARKVVALRPVDEDFETAAARLLAPPQWDEARSECLARLDEQIERHGEDAAESRPLLEARRRFIDPPSDGRNPT